MIDATPLVFLTVSLVSIGGIWILYSKLYHDYRVDPFREEVFALRDCMFDLVEHGQLSFDDEAYGLMRSTMNGFIRFAHKMSFLSMFFFIRQTTSQEILRYSFREKFNRSLQALSPNARESMLKLHK